MRFERMTCEEVSQYFEKHDTVLLTIGCLENHGSHNVLGVDTLVPEKLLSMIEEKSEIASAPGIPYGVCEDMVNYPGTVSIDEECMHMLLTQITEGLMRHGAKKIVFLNGHGGNIPTLNKICIELSQKGALGAQINWWKLAGQLNSVWGGGHGGGEETAAMLAVDSSLVHFDNLREQELMDDLGETFKTIGFDCVDFKGIGIPIPRDVDLYTSNGWIGPDHPKDATVQWGQEMLTAVSDYVTEFLAAFDGLKI